MDASWDVVRPRRHKQAVSVQYSRAIQIVLASLTNTLRHCLPIFGAAVVMSAVISLSWVSIALAKTPSELLKEARAAAESRNYGRAIEFYSAALDDKNLPNAERAEVLKRRALAYGETERFAEAEQDLSAAVKLEPDNPSGYSTRGFFYFERGRLEDAFSDFAKGAELDPHDASFPYWKGRVFHARSDFDNAIREYNEAIRMTPGVGLRYLWRAEAYLQTKMHAQAIADFDRALATRVLLPGSEAQAHLGRGFAYLSTDQFQAALRDFDKALAFNPDSRNGLRWRGMANDKLGNRERAIQDYERALVRDPNDSWVLNRLSKIRKN